MVEEYVLSGEGREGKEVKGYSVIKEGGGSIHVYCRLPFHDASREGLVL